MPKRRKAVVVGSANFPLDQGVLAQVVDIMRGLGEDVTILTRGAVGFDQFVMHASVVLGMRCLTFESAGGSDNWLRDARMVEAATEVHGFLSLEDFEKVGRMTGTLHVVEMGLNKKRQTTLYTVVEGSLIAAGET